MQGFMAEWLMPCAQAKRLTQEEYAMNHPAGRIGKRLMLRVADVMLTGAALPLCPPGTLIMDVCATETPVPNRWLKGARSEACGGGRSPHCRGARACAGCVSRCLGQLCLSILHNPEVELCNADSFVCMHALR